MLSLKVAACAALCLVAPWGAAWAQSQSDVAGQISTALPDNNRGQITASGLRGVLNSLNGARGQPNGIAGLGGDGKLPSSQFPSSGDASGFNITQGGLTQALPDAIASRARVGRTVVPDANYSGLATDAMIVVQPLTAARTITLPAVSAYQPGQILRVQDGSGQAGTYPLTVAAASGDTINGQSSITIAGAYNGFGFRCAGSNLWTVE